MKTSIVDGLVRADRAQALQASATPHVGTGGLTDFIDEASRFVANSPVNDATEHLHRAVSELALLRRQRDDLVEASAELLTHVVGDLPNRGWLRDNTASRRSIARLRAALRSAGEV